MSLFPEAVRSLYGAYRLALFDRRGHDYFDISVSGFWRSFMVAIYIAPFFVLLLIGQVGHGQVEISLGRFFALELSSYALTWLAFPVIMESLTRSLNCRDKFLAFMVAFNWSALLQNLVVILPILAGYYGILPKDSAQVLTMTLFLWTRLYAAFIAKTALDVSVITACGIVLLDVLLSLFLATIIAG